MDEQDGNGAFTHGGCYALDAAGSHVTDGEYARLARFQEEGPAGKRPPGFLQVLIGELHAGLDEPLRIERHAVLQPGRVWSRSGHDEHVTNVMAFEVAGQLAAPLDALQMTVSVERSEFRVRTYFDRRILLDAPDKIARHRVAQSLAPHQDIHLACGLGQEDRGLAGRVRAADHDDRL